MAKALFVTTNDLRRKSLVGGSVDADKFIQFIEVSQDIHIQNYLGTSLYDKISSLITGSTINDPANAAYKTLLNDYITPMPNLVCTVRPIICFASYPSK